jgi:hypothetical protein
MAFIGQSVSGFGSTSINININFFNTPITNENKKKDSGDELMSVVRFCQPVIIHSYQQLSRVGEVGEGEAEPIRLLDKLIKDMYARSAFEYERLYLNRLVKSWRLFMESRSNGTLISRKRSKTSSGSSRFLSKESRRSILGHGGLYLTFGHNA